MKFWNSFPVLRLILPFLAGLILCAFILDSLRFESYRFIIAACLVALTLIAGLLISNNGRKPHFFGLVMWLLFCLLGGLLAISSADYALPNYLQESNEREIGKVYIAQVAELPLVKERSVKVIADVIDVQREFTGKVLLYFEMDSLSKNLKHGDEMILRTNIEEVEGMNNPNEFNYSRYLRFHNIRFRGYVKSEGWEFLSEGPGTIKGLFLKIRAAMIEKLKEANLDGNELAVASALILGYRSDLDKELMSAYAGAGATHVLAVSGLHVGIVYVILNFILRFLDRGKTRRLFKQILIVVLLFSYAALTGLSASVFRAATMFTFVAFGKMISRDTNIFNTLAASAFCLILYQPMIVMQVGFQLSYAAVLGIVLIHPMLFELYSFNNRILDWMWSITCVSISAQVATFPLALLYFHQFPNMFLLSNLIVIPAAALILYVGFALFLFSWWKSALAVFGFLLKHIISGLNQLVVQIRNLPYSIIEGIDISVVETLLIYVIISSLLYTLLQKNIRGLYVGLIAGIVFTSMQIVEFTNQSQQKLVTVYNVKNETVVSFIEGTTATIFSSSDFASNDESQLFHVRHHLWNRGVNQELWVELTDSLVNRHIEWNNKSFCIANLKRVEDNSKLHFDTRSLDYLVLDKVDWKYIENLEELRANYVLVSNNVGAKSMSRIDEVCNSNSDVRFVSKEGAIMLGM